MIIRTLSWILAAFAAQSLAVADSDPEHTLYMMVSLTKDFIIGGKTQADSGVYRTRDRKHVEHVGFHHPRIDQAAFDPENPQILHLAALNGMLRSRDRGETWRITTDWRMTEGKAVVVDPHQPGRVFAGLPDGIAVSLDGGESWHYQDAGIARKYTQSLALHRKRKDWLLAATELGVYLSRNGGIVWNRVMPTRETVTQVTASPHSPAIFYAATQADGIWRSDDHGKTWTRVEGLPADTTMHRVVFHPENPELLAVCGWGFGVMTSADGGNTWKPANAGLPTLNLWNLAADPDFPGRLYASPFQEAVYMSDDFGVSWNRQFFEGAQVHDFQFVKEGGHQ